MKIKRFFVYALIASSLSFVAQSCSDDSDEPGPSEELNIVDQKQLLETNSIKFLNLVDSENFVHINNLANYVEREYVDNYNTSKVSQWFETCIEAITFESNNQSKSLTENFYTRLFKLSNFTGHFTAVNGEWQYTPADDLQFFFEDQNGQKCVAAVTYSGDMKKIYVGTDVEWDWGYNQEIIDYYEEFVYVPEMVKVSLTQGGKQLVSTIVRPNLKDMVGEEFDINKDSYDLTAEVKVEDYQWTISQASYKANYGAVVSMAFSKADQPLVSMKAEYDGKIGENEEDIDVHGVNIEADILHEIQLKGHIKDWNKFYDYLDKADQNDDDETNFKSYINSANELFNAGIYYNSNVRQADCKLMPLCDKDYYYEYWYAEPALFFKDGTSYNTFEVFFNEDDFQKLLRTFDDFVQGFENLN